MDILEGLVLFLIDNSLCSFVRSVLSGGKMRKEEDCCQTLDKSAEISRSRHYTSNPKQHSGAAWASGNIPPPPPNQNDKWTRATCSWPGRAKEERSNNPIRDNQLLGH